ncbi:cytochrome P450 4C1-like [Macrobrachium nipponense]|uniref:cytochrome P450 4C1-like n=1 Tax=Macrobrachium nipponense TaxID=159736 RepID=UPI0030C82E86
MAWIRSGEASFGPGVVALASLIPLIMLFLNWIIKRKGKVDAIGQLPGPKKLSAFAYSRIVGTSAPENFLLRSGMSYIWSFKAPIYQIQMGSTSRVHAIKARAAELVLNTIRNIDKTDGYKFLHPWLGTGLLTSTGEKWQSRRKLLTPAFHFKILEDFVDVFNGQSNTLIRKLGEKADGTTFDIFPYITRCALDIICETAMGYTASAQDDTDSEYMRTLTKLVRLVRERLSKVWLSIPFVFKLLGYAKKQKEYLAIVHGFTQKAIVERRAIRERQKSCESQKENSPEPSTEQDEIVFKGKKKLLAFLDLLLEYSDDGKALTDEEIQEEVDTFMFEGHDTTAASINWVLYFMGYYPEIQEKVYEELTSVLGDPDQPLTMADIRELNYLDRCIKESLRLYPSVPFVGRRLGEDIVVDNYRVPAGAEITIPPYTLHRDPEQFPNPQIFDPDRFLPENCKKRHPYAYVPFSAGPRNCIGQKFAMMEEKVILSKILRNFRVESTTRREDLVVSADLIVRPEHGNFVKLYPRSTE